MDIHSLLNEKINDFGESDELDDSPLTFGKYKGLTPDELSEVDPSYIVWMWETVEKRHCSRGMYNYCKTKISAADKLDSDDLRELDDLMRGAFED